MRWNRIQYPVEQVFLQIHNIYYMLSSNALKFLKCPKKGRRKLKWAIFIRHSTPWDRKWTKVLPFKHFQSFSLFNNLISWFLENHVNFSNLKNLKTVRILLIQIETKKNSCYIYVWKSHSIDEQQHNVKNSFIILSVSHFVCKFSHRVGKKIK